ncbi:MAG: hypothetical protein HY900_14960 [Deltaproteobacteria bacterium]|nr:hypothetical protein [Deltaproteobacteria bacterium]
MTKNSYTELPGPKTAESGLYPNPPVYPYFAVPLEEEITLLDLLAVLLKRWKLITLLALLGTGAAVYYALTAPPVFRAQALIAPPVREQASGASAALAAFGGVGAEIAGSMGINLGGADANRLETLLESHRLMERVIVRHDLLHVLFAQAWDAGAKKWKVADAALIPTVWDAERALRKKVFNVDNDAKAGILRVSAEYIEPSTAKAIVQYFLQELAVVVQEDRVKKLSTDRRFLEEQLRRASDPVILAKLQALLSDSVEKAMMAQNLDNLAYDLIDPPAVSDKKVKPRPVLIVAAGLTVSLMFGIFCAFLLEWRDKVRQRSSHAGVRAEVEPMRTSVDAEPQ